MLLVCGWGRSMGDPPGRSLGWRVWTLRVLSARWAAVSAQVIESGSIYDPAVLDITDADLQKKVRARGPVLLTIKKIHKNTSGSTSQASRSSMLGKVVPASPNTKP
jgi:hypothetical protein